MIQLDKDLATIEFKNGPAINDPQSCVRLAMEILNLSKNYSSLIKKGKTAGRKMNKTGRIREGIDRYVNKTDVTPTIIDNLIASIRVGKFKKIKAKIGDKEIELFPNNDVPGVIANLMVKKMI